MKNNKQGVLFHIFILCFTPNLPGICIVKKLELSLILPKYMILLKVPIDCAKLDMFVHDDGLRL